VLTGRTVHQTRFFCLRWACVVILSPLLGLSAEFVVFMVGGASKPDGPALVTFFAALTLLLPGMAAWVAGLTLRPVTLTRSALRIPKGSRQSSFLSMMSRGSGCSTTVPVPAHGQRTSGRCSSGDATDRCSAPVL
jgi:hypothetical protein